MSLPSFYKHVVQTVKTEIFKGGYAKTIEIFKSEVVDENINELFSMYRTQIKGIMIPPVLTDVNGDGVHDILMTSFD